MLSRKRSLQHQLLGRLALAAVDQQRVAQQPQHERDHRQLIPGELRAVGALERPQAVAVVVTVAASPSTKRRYALE